MQSFRVGSDVHVINDVVEIPGLGALPVNAFVLHAQEPLLVDTGMGTSREQFIETVGAVVDPADLRWIWLTHPDRDHTGSLLRLLDAAPQARLITTFTAVGYLSTEYAVPLDRVHLLNPGQSMSIGDRTLTAFRPPLFDSPMTVGFTEDKGGTCFSSDCFGAPLPSMADAQTHDVAEIPAETLRDAQRLWATVDSPWVHLVEEKRFEAELDAMRAFAPSLVCSSHLPPSTGLADRFLQTLWDVRDAPAFVGPDQQALAAMLQQLAGVPEQAGAPAAARAH